MRSARVWFTDRGYPESLVETQLERVINKERKDLFCVGPKRVIGVPLVLTYHPIFSNFSKMIYKHLPILYLGPRGKEIFTPPPFVSFRNGYNLKNHLVRAKIYPLVRVTGSFKCGQPRCQTCDNVKNTTSFKISVIWVIVTNALATFLP